MEAQEARYPDNGILRLYNQFPSMYANLSEMTADIPRIAAMNFNAVWVNPVHLSSRIQVQRGKSRVSASYYAAIDFYSIDNLIGDEDSLHRWIRTTREHGLIPVFDLVLKHVGVGIDFNTQKLKKEWFQPQNNESSMNDVIDFVYSFQEGESPATIRANEEQLKVIWREIFENFWKPYIKHWLDIGFNGVRLDAVRYLPSYVLRDVCAYVRELKREAVIFGELLYERNIEPMLDSLREYNVQITHITNSLYWTNFSTERRAEYFRNVQGSTPRMLGLLNTVTHEDPHRYGGSVGFGGSHDEDSLFTSCKKNLFVAKQKIASVAFTSTGGWFLICGDEFGYERKKNKPPFAFKVQGRGPLKINTHDWLLAGTERDLTGFILEINAALARLPRTTLHDWIEHLVLEPYPGLVIMLKNINLTETARVIIANSTNENVIIDQRMLEVIASEFERIQRMKPHQNDEAFFSYIENSKKTIMGMQYSPDKILTIGAVENRCFALSPRLGHRK